MELLAGWCVAVTADRRAAEQAQMLSARGARVHFARLVASGPCAEDELRARTRELLADPPDIVVGNTAVGIRSWIALAWSWGHGDALLTMLTNATLVARGTKAAGAFMSEGLDVDWLSSTETLADVADHLDAHAVAGRRVAVQLDGRLATPVLDRFRDAGATVIELPIYRTSAAEERASATRLAAMVEAGEVDAVTFTSPAAVAAYGDLDIVADGVVHACIGPVTADAARAIGLDNIVLPGRSRLGPMVRALAVAMRERSTALVLDNRSARLQGNRLAVAEVEQTLTPRERTLLAALVEARGAVVAKATLARLAWTEDVDEHAVEVTVNRLRRKLGVAASALETSNRRGYRLVLGAPSEAIADLA